MVNPMDISLRPFMQCDNDKLHPLKNIFLLETIRKVELFHFQKLKTTLVSFILRFDDIQPPNNKLVPIIRKRIRIEQN